MPKYYDLPMSDTFRLNTVALGIIRLGLNELIYRYPEDEFFVHRAKELRHMMCAKETALHDIERNFVRADWGGSPIYSLRCKKD